MGSHPTNLALRFALELCALAAFGYWGWRREHEVFRWVAALGLPLLAAVLWGVFAVPDDPSRSGETVVATPGAVRFLLELAIFGSAAAALHHAGAKWLALALSVTVLVHYLASYDRVAWLFKH